MIAVPTSSNQLDARSVALPETLFLVLQDAANVMYSLVLRMYRRSDKYVSSNLRRRGPASLKAAGALVANPEDLANSDEAAPESDA